MAVIEREIFEPTTIYSAHVAGRALIYLDNNVWIELADKKTADAVRCLELCRDAVRRKVALVPLSFPSITELLENPREAARLEQARIMDELSEGVCFRFHDEIVKLEAAAAAPIFAGGAPGVVDRSKLFTYVVGYIGDGLLEFPEGWNDQAADYFVKLVRAEPSTRSVSWLIQHVPLTVIQAEHRRLKDARMASGLGDETVRKIAEASRRPDGKLDRTAILNRERVAVFEIVYPHLRLASLAGRSIQEATRLVEAAIARDGEGGPAKLGEILEAMPACGLFAEVMVVRDMSPDRRERVQDHLDNEHARLAPAYVDVFVTLDSGLREILKRCSVPTKRRCSVLGSIAALTSYLERLVGTTSTS